MKPYSCFVSTVVCLLLINCGATTEIGSYPSAMNHEDHVLVVGGEPLTYRYLQRGGEVEVVNYPARWPATVSLVQADFGGFEGRLGPTFCQAVKERSAMATSPAYPGLFRTRAKEHIRKTNSISLRLTIAPEIRKTALEKTIQDHLRSQNIHLGQVTIVNPIQLRSIDPRIEWQDQALSPKIGDLLSIERRLARSLSQNYPVSGTVVAEFSEADFLCDLAAGNAGIVWNITYDTAHETEALASPTLVAKIESLTTSLKRSVTESVRLSAEESSVRDLSLLALSAILEHHFPEKSFRADEIVYVFNQVYDPSANSVIFDDFELWQRALAPRKLPQTAVAYLTFTTKTDQE